MNRIRRDSMFDGIHTANSLCSRLLFLSSAFARLLLALASFSFLPPLDPTTAEGPCISSSVVFLMKPSPWEECWNISFSKSELVLGNRSVCRKSSVFCKRSFWSWGLHFVSYQCYKCEIRLDTFPVSALACSVFQVKLKDSSFHEAATKYIS